MRDRLVTGHMILGPNLAVMDIICLTVLAQRGYFKENEFINYLGYLQYWKKQEYAKYLK